MLSGRNPRVGLFVLWLLCIQLALCLSPAGADSGGLVNSYAPAFLEQQNQSRGSQVAVGLVDGTVEFLDMATGSRLWTFDSGSPLVSSTYSHSDGEGDPVIFPSADGSLYTYQRSGEVTGIQKQHRTVPELVELSPSITGNGALLLGSKETQVFMLDAETGRLQKTFSSAEATQILDGDGNLDLLQEVDLERVVFIGRDDYTLKSVSMHGTGKELWNITYSRMQCMDHSHYAPRGPKGRLPKVSGVFRSTTDGTLQLLASDSQTPIWSVKFDQHPVAAFLDGRGGNVLARHSQKSLGSARDSRAVAGLKGQSRVLIGQLKDTVYVLPMEELSIAPADPLPVEKGDSAETGTEVFEVDAKSSKSMIGELICPELGFQTMVASEADEPKCISLSLPPSEPSRNLGIERSLRPAGGSFTAPWAAAASVLLFMPALWIIWGGSRRLPKNPKGKPVGDPKPSAASADASSGSDMSQVFQEESRARGSSAQAKAPSGEGSDVPAESSGDDTFAPLSDDSRVRGPMRDRVDEGNGIISVGRLKVNTQQVLGLGSAGTVVYGGELDGRPVAVKRLLLEFYDLARKELDTLVRSDDHPNIVRCFALEEDREFVYIALELCSSTLADLVESRRHPMTDSLGEPTELCLRITKDVVAGLQALHSRGIVHRDLKPVNILLTNVLAAKVSDMGLCKRLMAEQSSFHSAGPGGSSGWQAPEQLAHWLPGVNLKKNRQTRAVDVFSLGCVLYYCFTGGRHPFGNERFARDANIVKGKPNLKALAHLPLLQHLISCMLSRIPEDRPTLQAVMAHPAWWSAERQLAFLIDLSDRLEHEERDIMPHERALLNSLEASASSAIGGTGDWGDMLDASLMENLGRFRKYHTRSVRDLLRVVRNKSNHFREMPQELQERMGPQPEGFLSYFTSRFPNLLLSTWLWTMHNCSADPPLDKYFAEGSSKSYGWGYSPLRAALSEHRTLPRDPPPPPPRPDNRSPRMAWGDQDMTEDAAALPPLTMAMARSAMPVPMVVPPMPPPRLEYSMGGPLHFHEGIAIPAPPPPPRQPPPPRDPPPGFPQPHFVSQQGVQLPDQPAPPSSISAPDTHSKEHSEDQYDGSGFEEGEPYEEEVYEEEPYEEEEEYEAGEDQFEEGDPEREDGSGHEAGWTVVAASKGEGKPPGGNPKKYSSQRNDNRGRRDHVHERAKDNRWEFRERPGPKEPPSPPINFPYRPSEPICTFYERTGECKFGESCRFHHPAFFEIGVSHPVRPGQKPCEFFLKTGGCLYGANCMFDHPPEKAVPRDSEGYPLRPGQPLCPQLNMYGRCTQGWFCRYDHAM